MPSKTQSPQKLINAATDLEWASKIGVRSLNLTQTLLTAQPACTAFSSELKTGRLRSVKKEKVKKRMSITYSSNLKKGSFGSEPKKPPRDNCGIAVYFVSICSHGFLPF